MWTGYQIISRKDLRTQPGVLTLVPIQKTPRPKGAVEWVSKIGKTLAKPSFITTRGRPFRAIISWTCSGG